MLTTAILAVAIPYVMHTGVTTDPADPARGPIYGGQKLWH